MKIIKFWLTSTGNLEFRIKESKDKLKLNTQLPHLISTVAEIFDLEDDDQDEGSAVKKEASSTKQKGEIIWQND